MKAIIIEQSRFDREFESASKELELELRHDNRSNSEDLFRRANYILFQLRDRMRDGTGQ